MASWLSLVLFAAATVVAATEARAVPAEPVSMMMDATGNPVLFVREKRAPAHPYPHRAMMFTGYYRPARRTDEGQATGVFAQGNAVSGGTYLGDGRPNYLQRGPEPVDEANLSSAEAEAAPNPLEHHIDEEEQNYPAQKDQPEQQDSQPAQEEEQEPPTYATEVPVADEPVAPVTQRPRRPSKKQGPKKSKKTPVPVEPEDDEEDETENDDSDDDDDNEEPAVPFVPFKKNRRRQSNVPNLNNFFPMMFTFPKGYAREGSSSSGSPPGMITAIANSYSTSKGGVASSVATAYGGSPSSKKQRRSQPIRE